MSKPGLEVDAVAMKRSAEETLRIMRTLGTRVQKKVLGKGATAGGQVLLVEVRKQTPANNKLLRRSMDKKVKKYPSGNVSTVIGQNRTKVRRGSIRFTKAQARRREHGGGISGTGRVVPDHLVAGRVRWHRIHGKVIAGRQYKLRWTDGGSVRYAAAVLHAGHSGNNWHERAYRASYRRADRRTADVLGQQVDKEAAAVGKGA